MTLPKFVVEVLVSIVETYDVTVVVAQVGFAAYYVHARVGSC